MPENPDPEVPANPDPASTATATVAAPAATPAPQAQQFSWKTRLIPDYANSPTMQLFDDTVEGFNNAVKSHLELQKMMGYEKVPVPKDANDKMAIDMFKRAFKVPESPEGYGLADPEVPEPLKETLSFDKSMFQSALHKFNINPDQAKGLWGAYTEAVKQAIQNNNRKTSEAVTSSINKLRGEWGDAYQSKVDLGQMVINKFAEDQEMNDFITATMVQDPRGIKFLAKLGDQFAENKIGDFKYQRFSLTPEEAQREIDAIRNNDSHPYKNERASQSERDKAIQYVNSLYEIVSKAKTS